MARIVVILKNKKEEKMLKEFLENHSIEYVESEERFLVREEEVIYETKQTIQKKSGKQRLVSEINEAVENMKLIKQGKLKAKPAKDFLDEL